MGAMGLGLGLSFGGRASVATSAITGLTIMGATPLMDATNDYGDATARTGVNGNGWVAKVTVPYLVGQTFDPTKITINLSDPGYNSSGTTTVSRTIRGGKILRRQYTVGLGAVGAGYATQQANDGITLTVYFSLIADSGEQALVYQGTTITSASAAAGYYAASAAGAIASRTNSSTRAYYKPGFAWLNRHHTRTTGSGIAVEGVAMHKHAMNGQQVARIEYTAKDTTGNSSATVTVTAPTISAICTKGQPPEVFAATVAETALNQAEICFINAKVYPWLGDSTAILDLVADGIGVTGVLATGNPQTPLRFLCDKSGTYGGAHAAVKKGASGGTVQATRALAETTPYPDVITALKALPAWNTANKTGNVSHSGGTLWMMDNGAGGAVLDHLIVGSYNTVVVGNCLTEVRASPSNTAAVAIDVDASTHFVCSMLSWHVDMTQNAASIGWLQGVGGTTLPLTYFVDATHNYVRGDLTHNLNQRAGAINLTLTATGYISGGDPLFTLGGTTADPTDTVLLLGVVNRTGNSEKQIRTRAVIGCSFLQAYLDDLDPTVLTSLATSSGKIVVNNKFMRASNASTLGSNASYDTRGLFVGQNVFERAVGASTACVGIAYDSSVQAMDNVVFTQNSVVGNRMNVCYSDAAGAVGVIKRVYSRYNLIDQRNTKTDAFTSVSSLTGRVGNWEYVNGVDNYDLSLDGDSNSVGVPANAVWLGEYWANPTMAKVTRAAVTFTLDAGGSGGTNLGDGNYTLTGSSNAAYDRVPSGKSAFKFDLAGISRRTNGTGAVGAYERTIG